MFIEELSKLFSGQPNNLSTTKLQKKVVTRKRDDQQELKHTNTPE